MTIFGKTTLRRGVALAAITAMLGLAGAGHVQAQDKAPLKLGLFLEFTGGSSGTTSESVQLGAEIAVEEIDAAGGINGRKVTTVVADTQTDATVGVGEMKRLALQDKVDLVIGPVISQIQMAASPVLNEAGIASIGSTGSTAITPKTAPYYFSTLVSAPVQARKAAAYAADVLKVKSGAILSDSGAQAKEFVEAMRKEMAARDIKLAAVQEYQYRAADMTPQLLALKRSQPDTLFLFASSGEDVGNALKSMDELGWKPKVTGNWTVGAFVEAAEQVAGKDAMKGVTGSNYSGFTFCKGGQQPEAYLKLYAKAKAKNAALMERASMPILSLFYDSVYLMKAAIEGNGGKTDGKSVAAWIEAHGSSVKGVSGAISPTPDMHFLYGADALSIVYPGERGEAGIQQRAEGC
jgi:ABC-type branched-subunit amino acid transport system substrate-binding protein